jgi:HAD superfamily hydrolase (TIGR01490 family)
MSAMRLALFDLDHTLLDGDSNTLWLGFLDAHGLLPAGALQRQAAEYARYEAGTLDIAAYLRFQLSLLSGRPLAEWLDWRTRFVAERIAPRIAAEAHAAVAAHRARGDRLAILSATHSFLVEGIAALFAPIAAIAPQAEVVGERLSGRIVGEVCFAERKRGCLQAWLRQEGLAPESVAAAHFYSDSFNDLPLLEQVSHPVAVNADVRLAAVAAQRGWSRLAWRCVGDVLAGMK